MLQERQRASASPVRPGPPSPSLSSPLRPPRLDPRPHHPPPLASASAQGPPSTARSWPMLPPALQGALHAAGAAHPGMESRGSSSRAPSRAATVAAAGGGGRDGSRREAIHRRYTQLLRKRFGASKVKEDDVARVARGFGMTEEWLIFNQPTLCLRTPSKPNQQTARPPHGPNAGGDKHLSIGAVLPREAPVAAPGAPRRAAPPAPTSSTGASSRFPLLLRPSAGAGARQLLRRDLGRGVWRRLAEGTEGSGAAAAAAAPLPGGGTRGGGSTIVTRMGAARAPGAPAGARVPAPRSHRCAAAVCRCPRRVEPRPDDGGLAPAAAAGGGGGGAGRRQRGAFARGRRGGGGSGGRVGQGAPVPAAAAGPGGVGPGRRRNGRSRYVCVLMIKSLCGKRIDPAHLSHVFTTQPSHTGGHRGPPAPAPRRATPRRAVHQGAAAAGGDPARRGGVAGRAELSLYRCNKALRCVGVCGSLASAGCYLHTDTRTYISRTQAEAGGLPAAAPRGLGPGRRARGRRRGRGAARLGAGVEALRAREAGVERLLAATQRELARAEAARAMVGPAEAEIVRCEAAWRAARAMHGLLHERLAAAREEVGAGMAFVGQDVALAEAEAQRAALARADAFRLRCLRTPGTRLHGLVRAGLFAAGDPGSLRGALRLRRALRGVLAAHEARVTRVQAIWGLWRWRGRALQARVLRVLALRRQRRTQAGILMAWRRQAFLACRVQRWQRGGCATRPRRPCGCGAGRPSARRGRGRGKGRGWGGSFSGGASAPGAPTWARFGTSTPRRRSRRR